MTQPLRLASGGLVDRTRPLGFRYDGVAYSGYAGDTLASALLANDVHLVGRSFKYHRPRGIFSAGAEEPNALVQLGRGARTEPNVRATTLAQHREYLGTLAEDGHLLGSGPYSDGPPGALLVFQTAGRAVLDSLLAGDPFTVAGLIAETRVRAWDLVLGRWANEASGR